MRGLIMAAQQQQRDDVWLYKGLPFEYEEVTNPTTGRTWMDRNLGASRVATAFNDADSYGDLFQWGRLDDLHQNRDSATTAVLSSTDDPGHGDFITTSESPYDWRSPQNDELWQPGLINVPAPPGFRVPTEAEWEAERATWATNDRDGAYGSPLKLSAGGLRYYDGSLYDVGNYGIYWSSSVSGSNARGLYFYSSNANMYNLGRVSGRSVRLIKEL